MILNARTNSNHKLLLKLGDVRVDNKNDMGPSLSRLSMRPNATNDHYEYKSFMKEHFHFIKFKVPKYTLRLYTLRNVWRCNQVSIWRAVLISSPNLITKSSDRLLRLLTDS